MTLPKCECRVSDYTIIAHALFRWLKNRTYVYIRFIPTDTRGAHSALDS
ncbi:hypothetical protein [Staphylococcus coagulans]|nr:hypothetical protein [Staphylococcus coagulans]MBA8764804.1 hypothetical protein [Staphylococcus coagulans]MBT2810260.1 hypothetical protein [Staphylococcus coagulans]MBT2821559.1 hypothetical protein [Staphylococcus coagulans]MBT2823964.1 hypothetical protein [Staphylococcus coagulans]MBT2834601.1 hypothetical protein [Staphylococcus coagulans]